MNTNVLSTTTHHPSRNHPSSVPMPWFSRMVSSLRTRSSSVSRSARVAGAGVATGTGAFEGATETALYGPSGFMFEARAASFSRRVETRAPETPAPPPPAFCLGPSRSARVEKSVRRHLDLLRPRLLIFFPLFFRGFALGRPHRRVERRRGRRARRRRLDARDAGRDGRGERGTFFVFFFVQVRAPGADPSHRRLVERRGVAPRVQERTRTVTGRERSLDGVLVASRVVVASTRATGTLSGRPGGPAGDAPGTRTHSNGHDAAPTNTSLFTFPAVSVTVGYIELAAATHCPSTMNLNLYAPVGKMAIAECVGLRRTSSRTSSFASLKGTLSFARDNSSSFVLLVASVCVQPPATSPAICTSSPPPYQLIVTWCSFTSEEDAASDAFDAASFFSLRNTHRGARCSAMASVRRANLAEVERRGEVREPRPGAVIHVEVRQLRHAQLAAQVFARVEVDLAKQHVLLALGEPAQAWVQTAARVAPLAVKLDDEQRARAFVSVRRAHHVPQLLLGTHVDEVGRRGNVVPPGLSLVRAAACGGDGRDRAARRIPKMRRVPKRRRGGHAAPRRQAGRPRGNARARRARA